MKMNETLACKLSIMRKLYGKSLVEFAEEIDVSKTTLQNIEVGKANLTLNMVETIANIPSLSFSIVSSSYLAYGRRAYLFNIIIVTKNSNILELVFGSKKPSRF